MTPAEKQALDTLNAAAAVVDVNYPHLRLVNTYASCCEFVQRTLAELGQGWAHIGKTTGESAYAPPNFEPVMVMCTDPNGNEVAVHITQVSHDAVWNLLIGRQYDLIGNAAANSDPNESIHGPAVIDAHLIDPQYYRWYNPAIPAIPVEGEEVPGPQPPNGDVPPFPPRNETMAFGLALNDHYRIKGAGQNGTLGGQYGDVTRHTDYEGEVVWTQEYLRLRQLGASHDNATAQVLALVDDAWS